MTTIDSTAVVGVVGAGTMGSGIAQVAAAGGHTTLVFDTEPEVRRHGHARLRAVLDRLVEKGVMAREDAGGVFARIRFVDNAGALDRCGLVIEAIIEDLTAKRTLFADLERLLPQDAILATNTSSLSITAIASACYEPGRVVGTHFFNPAPRMPLVEIVPGVATDRDVVAAVRERVAAWGKTPVVAKDTPGFIVNRVARPFYGEALRILDEGIADVATIDWAMRELGGFRMGPFELMDFIGNDVNYVVTESVFEAFYGDPRYRPSFTQKRMVEAGRLGRKSEHGFYDYREGAVAPEPTRDPALGEAIVARVVAMLVNEAADALLWSVASRDDIDLAMTQGVHYPKGLLAWADEIGVARVLDRLETLHAEYGEDRYRPSPLLRRMARTGRTFYP